MADLEAILKDRFGHESLRPLQARIIRRLMGDGEGGGDALVVMPTGSGKSLCFQLPALALPGIDGGWGGVTLVFSPLIALMEDQVAALKRKGISAEYINSTLGKKERLKRYRKLGEGAYELIYATPERMHKPEFIEALEQVPGGVKLLAVDEAHCISKWGHDLRPAYQQVGEFWKQLGKPRLIALTATATPAVREDIRATLGHDEESMPLFASGIDRPNLSFEVRPVWDDADKDAAIAEVSKQMHGTGIVYFSLIKDLERARERLRGKLPGREIEVYHGKLDPGEKKRVYKRFIKAWPEEGLVLLATNAFGMGVDKPDIRFIMHAQVPGSVEAYYQEVGRAGRDGDASRCVLLYAEEDLAIQQQFVEWMNPCADLMARAAATMQGSGHADHDADELHLEIVGRGRGDRRMEYCLITLEKLGVVEATSEMGRYRFVRPVRDEELEPDEIAAKRQRDLMRLLEVVKLTKCDDMRSFVVDYFGLEATV